ncbi:hypothetical protein B4902_08515 [Yersinia frederiksenii]|uniref:hypothetical protein n=1 Tax=Yersinia frederiksenii TaxID=29484 RepID=UPI000B48DE1B|nr:hypothetical protein [Yersinia frederiksenii]OWF73312.1 hypothetical protein B4902_08515 [Yersinia frederiksenii]
MSAIIEIEAAKKQGAVETLELIRTIVYANAYTIGLLHGRETADEYIKLFDDVLKPLKKNIEQSGGAK